MWNTLCIYEVTTLRKGIIDINSNSWITVIDPDALVQQCLVTPCNLTTQSPKNNDIYIVSRYSMIDFNITYTPKARDLIPKGLQAWLFITYISLAGVAIVFSCLATFVCIKLKRARMSKS